jgi:histidyl-tRNA synthetase
MKYQGVKGTMDFLPETAELAYRLESSARTVFARYGYKELRLPVLENLNLFLRGLGETTDIVQKQLFKIDGKDDLCLRPEGTAQAVRSCIEHNLFELNDRTRKLFYIGAMFRGERPQKGRLRQFHQMGAEAIGGRSPELDAEIIKTAYDILISFGLKHGEHFCLEINTLGSADDKKRFEEALRHKLAGKRDVLCDVCKNRYDGNVLRVLDCKNPACKDIVAGIDIDRAHISEESRAYFSRVLELLTSFGITGFKDDPMLVRGLDYYTHTVFEFTTTLLGAQSAIGAGGRYDGLVAELGGPMTPCCGFGLGLERIMLLLEGTTKESGVTAFVAYAGDACFPKAFETVMRLRSEGIAAEFDFTKSSLKSQLKYSQKLGAAYVLIIGDDELKNETVALRDMSKSDQVVVAYADAVSAIKKN